MTSLSKETDNPNGAKERILHAAGGIFADKGFRSATVREICDAAGVNIASVNYYFGDKKSLYQKTLLLAREIGAQKFPTPDFSELATPEDRLRSIILLLLNRLVGGQIEPWPVKILMSEILAPSAAAKPLIDGYIEPFLKEVFNTVSELTNGTLCDSKIHQLSFSVVSQCVWYRFAGDINQMMITEEQYTSNFSVNRLAKQILDFSLAGIRDAAEKAKTETSTGARTSAAPEPFKIGNNPRAVVESTV